MQPPPDDFWKVGALAPDPLATSVASPPSSQSEQPSPALPDDAPDLVAVAADLAATVADNSRAFDASLLRTAFQAAGGAQGFIAWARSNPDNVYRLSLAVARDRIRTDHQASKPAQLIAVRINCGIPNVPPAIVQASADIFPQLTGTIPDTAPD